MSRLGPAAALPVLAAATAVLTILAACGSAPVGSPSAAASATPSDAASPAGAGSGAASADPGAPPLWLPEWADPADVPAAVANRRPLRFCGLEKAPAPQPGEFIDRAVRLCFWEAHQAGLEAEFASVQSTIEGAQIATIYRALSDGSVEVLTDFSQDPLGSGGWQAATCKRLVEGEGNALLGVDECGETRTLE